MTNKIDNCKF